MNENARELHLYIVNTGEMYPQRQAIEKNLTIKKAKGVFNATLAAMLWLYWVTAGAKRYVKEYSKGTPWQYVFSMVDRQAVAKALVDEFEAEYANGAFNKYVPKKYALKFKDLKEGDLFEFHHGTESRTAIASGPWVKLRGRQYRHRDEPDRGGPKRGSTVHTVGTTSALVEKLPYKEMMASKWLS